MAQRMGPYKLLRRLGQGGMAEVWLAEEESLSGTSRLVCLKQILPHLRVQETFLKMFLDEARIVMRMSHPHIAQVYQVVEIEQQVLLVMEYIHGEDLRSIYNQEVLQGQTVPFQVAARIMHDVALGLDYAHRQLDRDGQPLHLVHRDVSPQNILITYDGYAKIIDFGVAKATTNINKTRTGVLKGKYSYMSPEQAHGEKIDQRSDLFSLGITIYEIICGKRLFKRESDIETLQAVAQADVPKPSHLIKGFPKELEAILLKTLAKAPEQRFAHAAALAEACNHYLRKSHQGYPQSELGQYMHTLFAEKLAKSTQSGASKPSFSGSGPSLIASDEVLLTDEATVLTTQHDSSIGHQTQALASWLPPSTERSTSAPAIEATHFLQTIKTQSNPESLPQEQKTTQPALAARPLEGPSPEEHAARQRHLVPEPPPLNVAVQRWPWLASLGVFLLLLGILIWWQWTQSTASHTKAVDNKDMAEITHQPMPEGMTEKSLLLLTGPKLVNVLIDGQPMGQLPLPEIPLRPGTYNITLNHPAMAYVRQERLMVGPQERIAWNMLASQRSIRFVIEPWGFVQLGQQMPFDSLAPQDQPAEQSLMVGSYTVLIECPDGRRYERLLHVTPFSEPQFIFHCPGNNTAQ